MTVLSAESEIVQVMEIVQDMTGMILQEDMSLLASRHVLGDRTNATEEIVGPLHHPVNAITVGF